jgi:serine protease inhibitor
MKDVNFANLRVPMDDIRDWGRKELDGADGIGFSAPYLEQRTRAVTASAIRVQAKWEKPLTVSDYGQFKFMTVSGYEQPTTLLAGKTKARLFTGDGFKAAEVPFSGGQISLLVFLADQPNALGSLVKKVTPENLKTWTAKPWEEQELTFAVPKFRITWDTGTTERIRRMGVADAFNETKADFSGAMYEKKMSVIAANHKPFFELNETGLNGAMASVFVAVGSYQDELGDVPLATAVEPEGHAVSEAKRTPERDHKKEDGPAASGNATFAANRPFVLIVCHNTTGAFLFIGRVEFPTN